MLANLDDATFEEYISGAEKPVLVEFWVSWCIPCKRLQSLLKEIAYLYKDKLSCKRFDAEHDTTAVTLKKHNIKGFPTLMIFKEGKAIARQVGGEFDKNRVVAFLDSHI